MRLYTARLSDWHWQSTERIIGVNGPHGSRVRKKKNRRRIDVYSHILFIHYAALEGAILVSFSSSNCRK